MSRGKWLVPFYADVDSGDTESSVDLVVRGWSLFNFPETRPP